MTTATWGDVWWRIRESVYTVLDERTRLENTTPGTGYQGDEDRINADRVPFDSDIAQAFSSGLTQLRTGYSAGISSTAWRTLLDPCLIQLSRAMGKPQVNALAVLPIMYDYMSLNQGGFPSAPAVQSRNFSYGSWTAGGSNTGTGTVNRLTVDQYGNNLESNYGEVKAFTCLADYQSGTNPGQEQFDCFGYPRRDAISRYATGYGSGLALQVGALTGITGDDTQALVLNPSFSDFSGTGASSSFALSNWTLSSGTAASMSVVQGGVGTGATNVYRICAIEQTPGALKCTGSVTLTQTLATRAGSLDSTAAYWTQLAINGTAGTWSGSVVVTIGNLTWTTNSGGSNWVISKPTTNKNLYFYNFNTNALTVSIAITVNSGYVLIDDFIWAPMTNIDGTLWAAVGGATPWRYYDTGTTTDTEGTTRVIQRAFVEAYGWSLPARVFATAPTNPTVAQSATGGSVTAGNHGVVVTFLTSGVESPPSTPQYVQMDGSHKLAVTSIQTGPGGTTARKVYQTTAGPGRTFYLAATISDNVTTTADLNTDDATLAVAANQLGPIVDFISTSVTP